jgi:hypothetical protein
MTDFDPTAEPDPARPGCEAGQSALQRLLDGEPHWDAPEAAAHRAACADCREELALARTLARLPAEVVVPAGFADRTVRAALRARRRRRSLQVAGAGLALAASLLVVVLVNRPRPGPAPDDSRLVVVVPGPNQDVATATPEKPLGEAVSEARDAIVQLTKRTATEPGERIGRLLPSPPTLPGGPDAGDELQPLADARTGAARSVEPIRQSARRAVYFFLRTSEPPDRAQP